jgi:hypothetical protein
MKPAWAMVRREGMAVHGIGMASLGAFLVCFLVLVNWYFPEVGHDYYLFFGELLEGVWQFHHFGLAIPRYALHLCGGSVLYGNPQDMFYSPTQVFFLLWGPWTAVLLTITTSLIAGYLGWFKVGRDVMVLPREWCHVLALVVVSNGFYFMHLAAGHVTFAAFPLLGWFFWLLFERNGPIVPASIARRAAVFALLSAYVLYSGNWIVLFFLALGFLLALPLDIFLSEQPKRRLAQVMFRTALFAVTALAILGSKLVAIYSFMRFFPRTVPLVAQDPARSTLGFIVKSLWGIPQTGQLLEGIPGYAHEKSILIAPITVVGLVLGLLLLLASIRRRTGRARVVLIVFALVYGGTVFLAMLHLVRGHGTIAEALHALPVGKAQRISSRYLYLFSLLLSVAGIWSVAKAMSRLGGKWNVRGMLLATVTTVVAFYIGCAGMLPVIGFWPNAKDHYEVWRQFDPSISVTRVVAGTDFIAGTGRTCYEPVLNAAGDLFSILHVGPVSDREDGYFNLMNPACYQYPDENHCKPGDRIAVADGDNLSRFTGGRPVTWKVSRAQEIADIVSALALLLCLIAPRYLAVLFRRGSSGAREVKG